MSQRSFTDGRAGSPGTNDLEGITMASTKASVFSSFGKMIEVDVELGPAVRTSPGHTKRHVIVDGVDAGYVESFTSSIRSLYPGTRIRRITKERKFWRAMSASHHRVSNKLEETRANAIDQLLSHHVRARENTPHAPAQ